MVATSICPFDSPVSPNRSDSCYTIKKAIDHRQQLEKLNTASLMHLEEYLKSKGQLKKDEHLKVVKAKEDWQVAWNKFMETLMVLKRLEL